MSKLKLTILKFTYVEVPTHMVSIGDMHPNGTQYHAPPDDPDMCPVIFVFYCMFLFYQFQPF